MQNRPERATASRGPMSELARMAARLPDRPVQIRPMAPKPIAAKSVGSFVPRLTKPAFERYGFSAAALITDWETIVGTDLARYTMPERLKWPRQVEWSGDVADGDKGRPGATLILSVAAGRALDVQYSAAQIVDRINAYFGYRAVADLRIVQVAGIRREPDRAVAEPASPASTTPAKPREELAAIQEPGLRAALESMAAGLGRRRARGLSVA